MNKYLPDNLASTKKVESFGQESETNSERRNTLVWDLKTSNHRSRNKIQHRALPFTIILLSDSTADFEHCPEKRLSGLSEKLLKLSLDIQFQSSYPTSFRGICLLSHLTLTYGTPAKTDRLTLDGMSLQDKVPG